MQEPRRDAPRAAGVAPDTSEALMRTPIALRTGRSYYCGFEIPRDGQVVIQLAKPGVLVRIQWPLFTRLEFLETPHAALNMRTRSDLFFRQGALEYVDSFPLFLERATPLTLTFARPPRDAPPRLSGGAFFLTPEATPSEQKKTT